MKGTLRIITVNGKLSAEYSDNTQLDRRDYTSKESYYSDKEKFESSFQPITLSSQTDNYLKGNIIMILPDRDSIELSGKDLDCFEIENEPVLHLKPTVTPQINSITKCPTCGSQVKIGGDGTSQFYIPTPNESDALWNRVFSMLGLSSHSLSYKSLNDTKDLIKQNFHITKK